MTTAEWQIDDSTSKVRRLTNQLVGYFKRRIPEHEDPRDYVAEVWIAAGAGYRGEASLNHYLFQIARRKVAEYWRRDSRRPEHVELAAELEGDLPIDVPGCETALGWLQQYGVVDEAVELVDPVYRDAIRLHLQGRDAMQIAEALGVKYHTARSRIVRGRRQLIALLRTTDD